MAIRKIARMGHPVLRQRAREITREEIGSPEICQLINDMIETMHEYGGIGLAAPQVHESIMLAIIEVSRNQARYPVQEESPLLVLINPQVTVLDSVVQGYWEGCLSVPDLRGWVERPSKIKIDYLDQNGNSQTMTAEGFLSTVFQHELDHLQGVLYVDHIKDMTRLAFLEEYRRYWLSEAKVEN